MTLNYWVMLGDGCQVPKLYGIVALYLAPTGSLPCVRKLTSLPDGTPGGVFPKHACAQNKITNNLD